MAPQVHKLEVADGQCVALDWHAVSDPTGAALFVHGLGSHRRGEKAQYLARRFNDRGWAFAAVDLRGHGQSDGRMRDLTLSGMLADVSVARAWVAERTGHSDIVPIGASLGAAVIAWHTALHAPGTERLVMIAPSLSFPASLASGLAADELDRWRRTGVHRFSNQWIDVEIGYGLMQDGEKYDPATLERRHAATTLILHGLRDQTVAWDASTAFAQRCAGPVDVFLVGAGDHRLTDHKELLFDVIWSWLAQPGAVPRPPESPPRSRGRGRRPGQSW